MSLKETAQRNEKLHPEYWLKVFQERGEFWLHGKFSDTQVSKFIKETYSQESDYVGHKGTSQDVDFQNYDVHLQSEHYIGQICNPSTLYEYSDLNDFLLECTELNSNATWIDFSFRFNNFGFAQRGPQGVSTTFNFRLTPEDAHNFIDALNEKPELLLDILHARYGNLVTPGKNKVLKFLYDIPSEYFKQNPFIKKQNSHQVNKKDTATFVEEHLCIYSLHGAASNEECENEWKKMISYVSAGSERKSPKNQKKFTAEELLTALFARKKE